MICCDRNGVENGVDSIPLVFIAPQSFTEQARIPVLGVFQAHVGGYRFYPHVRTYVTKLKPQGFFSGINNLKE